VYLNELRQDSYFGVTGPTFRRRRRVERTAVQCKDAPLETEATYLGSDVGGSMREGAPPTICPAVVRSLPFSGSLTKR
jgi:hypothetical protein